MKNNLMIVIKVTAFLVCIYMGVLINVSDAKADDVSFTIFKDKTSTYSGKTATLNRIGRYTGGATTMGTYPRRKGAILVTLDGSVAKLLGHAAIVYSSGTVIESLSDGVCIGKNNWNVTCNRVAASAVRETNCKQDCEAAEWCRKQVGKKYNYNYLNVSTRKTLYCSQLVWAGYLETQGVNLNTKAYDIVGFKPVGPLEFVRKSTVYTFPIYMKNWNKEDITA